MTRINLVDPAYITDKMLLAEYHEIPRVFTLVRKAIIRGEQPDFNDPPKFSMGKGHVRFFYPRLDYLLVRYSMVKAELKVRGRNLNPVPAEDLLWGIQNEWVSSRWIPSMEDVKVSVKRLKERKGLIKL